MWDGMAYAPILYCGKSSFRQLKEVAHSSPAYVYLLQEKNKKTMDLAALPALPSVRSTGSAGPRGQFPGRMTATKKLSISDSTPDIEETGVMPSVWSLKRSKTSLISSWPTTTLLVGLSLLFFSLCGGFRRFHSGVTVRKLSDDGGHRESSSGGNPLFTENEWIPLDENELAALCAELGEWTPSAAVRRPSTRPTHMPEVASTLGKYAGEYTMQPIHTPSDLPRVSSNGQQPQVVTSSQHNGKRTSQGSLDIWGPSQSKLIRLAYDNSGVAGAGTQSSAVQRPSESVQSAAAPCERFEVVDIPAAPSSFVQEGVATPVSDLQGAQQSQRVALPAVHRLPSFPPETSSVSSTGRAILISNQLGESIQASATKIISVPAPQSHSVASAGPSPQVFNEASRQSAVLRGLSAPEASSVLRSKHPFVQMPTLMPSVRVADIADRIPESSISGEPLVFLFRTVRHLSLKPALNLNEANELVRVATSLARRALSTMTSPLFNVRASMAADALGRRFLVFNVFHAVLTLTAGSKPYLMQLWQNLVASVPTVYCRRRWSPYNEKHSFQHDLSHQLSAALALYKNGLSPSESEVVAIKRKLFCSKYTPRSFVGDAWNLWREDDANYTGAT